MKATDLKTIQKVVREYRLVSDRVEKLRDMGYTVKECAMGSGGVLHVKKMKGETRIQVGYGKGRYNYAYAVIIEKKILCSNYRKENIMKASSEQEKRYQTTVIVVYRKSSTTRRVSFDTFEEAKKVVEEQRIKHPRSKKFNGCVYDSVERRSILI